MTQHEFDRLVEQVQSGQISRRKLLAVAGLAGAAAVLAACNNAVSSVAPSAASAAPSAVPSVAPSASAAAAETIPLRVLVASGSHRTFLSAVEESWNKGQNPFKVKLDITEDSNENIMTSVKLALAGQTPPDFTTMYTGKNAFVGDVVEAGLIVDLAPYVQKYGWAERFDPGMWFQLLWPAEKTYQMAYQGGPLQFIWYNTDLFKQNSLTVPADRRVTEDQLFDFVKVLKAAKLEGISMGNKDAWPAEHLFRMILLQVAGADYAEKLQDRGMSNTGVNFTDPQVTATGAKAQDWVKRGLFAPGMNAIPDGDAISLFAKRKAGMYAAGFWGLDVIPAADPTLPFDYFHYPQLDPQFPVTLSSSPSAGFVISTKSKYPDQIAAFLDFMMTQDGQRIALEQASIFPATTQLKGVTDLKVKLPLWNDLISDVSATPSSRYALAASSPAELATAGNKAWQSVMDLSLTPAEFGKQMQALVPA